MQTPAHELTPQRRVELINAMRQRVLNGEEVTQEELMYGVELLAIERQGRVASSGPGKSAAKKESAAAAQAKVNNLLGDL